MANLKLSYPYEKFMTAVSVMSSSENTLSERIYSAYMSFHPVREEDLDGEIAQNYSQLMALLTEVKDGPEDNGYVKNTLDSANPDQLQKIADLIFEIFLEITSEYFGRHD